MTDYIPVNQVLTFNSNDAVCVDVVIREDSVLEDSETFLIFLSSSDFSVIIGDISVASIIISDNDG